MVDREKSQQARLIGLSERLKEDRISELREPLISQILSYLPSKDVVRTSVLSTRWRSLWLWVPRLELNSREFPDLSTFVSFGDRFFDSSRASCIDKLKLRIDAGNEDNVDVASSLKSWIDAAVKRKIQDLYVRRRTQDFYVMPPSLYTCETLVSLELLFVVLINAEFVSLPCLKTMQLKYIKFPNEATFERLVSSCPVLEELEIVGVNDSGARVFRVFSRSLKSLILRILWPLLFLGIGVVIDAPRLCFLSIKDKIFESFVIVNIDSNAELYLDFDFKFGPFYKPNFSSERDRLRSFLRMISKLRDITVARDTFELFYQYSKFEPLPQFGNMSCLHVTLCVYDLIWLPTLLESCPNLKSLTMVCSGDYEEINEISFSFVPECLLSSLEFVDFKRPISGCAAEMELVRYFLKNSVILKRLTLCLCLDSSSTKDDIFKKLLEIPRGSTKCKVLIL